MKDEELEKTKPIKPVGSEHISREEKFEDVISEELETREEKYQKKLEEEEIKEAEEEAEIALAEKNAELADEIEASELRAKLKEELGDEPDDEDVEVKPKKKEKPLVRLKNWWKSLDKSQKWIYGIIALLFFLLFVLLLVGVIALLHKEKPVQEEKPVEQTIEEEKAPIMFDNYYYKDGVLVFLSEGGSELGSYTCDNKDEKLCSVAVNNYRDVLDVPRVVDESGSDVTEYVAIVNDDYVFINDRESETSKNIVLYSIKKQERVATYHDVKAYDGGLYAVSNTNDEYGLISIGEEVKQLIKFQYPYLGMIDNENYLVAKESKGFIIIDKKDRGISKHINTQEVKYYNNNLIVTKDEGTYSVYNFKGEQLENGYSFATVRNKYMFLIDSKQVYVKDMEGNKYNEKGVELKNFEYLKSFVYNDNDEMVRTKRSFEIEVKGDNIAIAVYDVDYDNPQFSNLSITEGTINKNYEYINYFDGVLYLYRDAEKKDLIGSYTCTFKNEVNSKSTEYTDCFIAKDYIFEDNDTTTDDIKNRKTMIPLINNKYIFVSDGDNNVVLFDVEAGVKKSAYTNVNTYYDNNGYKFTSTEGKFDIVALNKKGKYGVIRIDGYNVSSLHSFNYNKIEKIGDYFIGQDTNGKWFIFANDQTIGIYKDKIAGFTSDLKYVKTTDGSKYRVYQFDGTPVSEDSYKYVELFGSYYGAVNDERKITIFDYSGNRASNEEVEIPSGVAYTRTDKQPFKVKKTNEGFVVSVYDGSKYVDHNVSVYVDPHPAPPEPTEPENSEQN